MQPLSLLVCTHTHIQPPGQSTLLSLSHSDLRGRLCNAALLRTRHENINTTSPHFNHVNKQGHPNFQLELVWKEGNGLDKTRPRPLLYLDLWKESRSWSRSWSGSGSGTLDISSADTVAAAQSRLVFHIRLQLHCAPLCYHLRMGLTQTFTKFRYGHGTNTQDLILIPMKSP